MHKMELYRFLKILFIFFHISFSALYSQSGELPTAVIKSNALNDFNNSDYAAALEKYDILLSKYPKDGLFHYYRGICLFHLNRDLSGAAESLEFASTRPNVPSDASYFLGLVYLKSYRFTDSRISFERFSRLATRQEIKALDVDRQLQIVENAIGFTLDYNPVEIIASSLFSFNDSIYIRQVNSTGGRLIQKPSELVNSGEQDGELTNFMFLPRVIDKTDYVYFAAQSKGGKTGSDLFRAKFINGKKWGDIEPLSSLNTPYDEVLPYFDPIGKDLYFASKGHKNMGGFDIFKSHYDEIRSSWSEPVNLGFPINSPYDDFLFIPRSDLGSVLLVTDRQGINDMLTVYRLNIQEPRKSLANADLNELKRIGNFGGIESIPRIVDIREVSFIPEENGINESAEKSADQKQQKDLSSSLPDSYSDNLKKALVFQFKADSLSKLAREARIKTKDQSDPNERWALQKEILEWERNSREYQSRADEYYVSMKEMEGDIQKEKQIPATIKAEKLINDITVYHFTEETNKKELEKSEISEQSLINEKEIIPVKPVHEAKKQEDKHQPFNRFVISEKSPYSVNNPFPLDLPLPEGALYKIQLGVFSQKVSYDAFGGISPITGETIHDRNLRRFYAGKFSTYDDALKALESIKKQGFKDAFIVAWYNGQKMPPAKVVELEKRDY